MRDSGGLIGLIGPLHGRRYPLAVPVPFARQREVGLQVLLYQTVEDGPLGAVPGVGSGSASCGLATMSAARSDHADSCFYVQHSRVTGGPRRTSAASAVVDARSCGFGDRSGSVGAVSPPGALRRRTWRRRDHVDGARAPDRAWDQAGATANPGSASVVDPALGEPESKALHLARQGACGRQAVQPTAVPDEEAGALGLIELVVVSEPAEV